MAKYGNPIERCEMLYTFYLNRISDLFFHGLTFDSKYSMRTYFTQYFCHNFMVKFPSK